MAYSLAQGADRLLDWYRAHARKLPWRENPGAYAVWVSEIMLQQTRVEAVKPYFERFVQALPTPAALAQAPEEQLLKLWEGLGYYSRVRNLQKAARVLCEQYGGELPDTAEQLLRLPGIGPYTAGAIASIAYGKTEAAVDGNVLRVLARLDNDDSDVFSPAGKKAAQQRVRAAIPPGQAGAFNQALMELGATVCLPVGKPLCGDCPLREDCLGLAAGRQEALPVKKKKQPRRREEKTVLVLQSEAGVLMRKRPPKGLLAGLWELPALPGKQGTEAVLSWLTQWHIQPLDEIVLGEAVHIFTHVEWQMRVCGLHCANAVPPPGWCFSSPAGDHALPTAFRVCLRAVGVEQEPEKP